MAHDTTDAHDGLIGAVLDERYELTSVVGRGGMGIVYGALDRKLSGRPCAIKLLTGHAGDPEENRRFERELDHIARLRSRHVVQVLDAGQLPDKRRFIVMELLEGNTLAALLKREGPLSAERAIPLARGVLAGLAEAHDNGIVHRDLKPANVFIVQTRTGEEIAKILDFGIAKETSTDVEDLTGRSMLIGTPKYMAPEQFKKQRADGRTDLYAAGLLLYEMLSGAPPFTPHTRVPASIEQMPDEFRIGWLHVNQAPPPLRGFDAVWPVIERLLAKKPERRYEDANAVIEALGQLGKRTGPPAPRIAGEPSQPGLTSMASTTGFPVLGETLDLPAHRPRRPLVRALVGLALLALVSGGAWFALNEDSSAARSARTAVCLDRLETEPEGAVVLIGDRPQGITPLTLRRPCNEKWLVRLEKKGFVDVGRELGGRAPQSTARFELQAEAPLIIVANPPDAEAVAERARPPDAAPPVEAPRANPPPPRRRRPRPVTRPIAQPTPPPTPPAQTPDAAPPKKPSPLYF